KRIMTTAGQRCRFALCQFQFAPDAAQFLALDAALFMHPGIAGGGITTHGSRIQLRGATACTPPPTQIFYLCSLVSQKQGFMCEALHATAAFLTTLRTLLAAWHGYFSLNCTTGAPSRIVILM